MSFSKKERTTATAHIADQQHSAAASGLSAALASDQQRRAFVLASEESDGEAQFSSGHNQEMARLFAEMNRSKIRLVSLHEWLKTASP